MKNGAEEVTQVIREEITAAALDMSIHTSRTRCNGRCHDACVVIVYPEGVWYKSMTPELGKEMVSKHLINKELLRENVLYTYTEDSFKLHPGSVIGTKKLK